MDIDKLLAGFQSVVEEHAKNSPLLEVGTYVPPKTENFEANEEGARRLVAAFLYWLITRGQILPVRKRDFLDEINAMNLRKLSPTFLLKQKFSDQILITDIKDSAHQFSREYLSPSAGGLASDYHALFVEGTELSSFLDVDESWEKLDEIARLIDARFVAFSSNDKNWNEEYQKRNNLPTLRFGNTDEWIAAIRTFDDLEKTPAGKYKARVQQYWTIVDAASERPPLEVTQELVRTYLNIKDASVQESVWRILRLHPLPLVLSAILDNIQELSRRTGWAPTLVDIFDDNLPEAILDELVQLLGQAPVEALRSYVKALEKAKKAGSLHAAQLLEKLYPKS